LSYKKGPSLTLIESISIPSTHLIVSHRISSHITLKSFSQLNPCLHIMLSEFGAHKQSVSEGHITLDYSSNKKLTFHRRAQSLFSLHRNHGSITSLAGMTPTSSSSCDNKPNINGCLDESPQMKSITQRRLQYIITDNWRPYDDDIMEKQGLDRDAFVGLALTTADETPCRPATPVPSYECGRRMTQQALRQYHRPTELMVDLKPIEQVVVPEPAKIVRAGKKSPAKSPSHADWSPALLSSIITLHSCSSSSSLDDEDDSSSECSSDNLTPTVWKISTTDAEGPSPFVPPYQWNGWEGLL
jgi:hypothetical protein